MDKKIIEKSLRFKIKPKNLLLFLFVFILIGCKPQEELPEVFSFTGSTMGTTYSVKIVKSDSLVSKFSLNTLRHKTDSILQNVNKQMSTYLPDSEISRFNKFLCTAG